MRKLTELGEERVGKPREVIKTLYEGAEIQTTLRLPEKLQRRVDDLGRDYGCSYNDMYLVALEAWVRDVPSSSEKDQGRSATKTEGSQGRWDDNLPLLHHLLAHGAAWRQGDNQAKKEFWEGSVGEVALLLHRRREALSYVDIFDAVSVARKLEALAAGEIFTVAALRLNMRPRIRCRRLFSIDGELFVLSASEDKVLLKPAKSRRGAKVMNLR